MRARLSILTLLLTLLSASCQRKAAASRTADQVPVNFANSARVPVARPSRPVHPYSVVSGGLTGPEEMATAVSEDKVVSEHYAGLIPTRFKAEKLQSDRQGYVSYRVGDKIFWTERMMTLKKGEMVLTDGSTLLRGRCGNRVSASPMEPVAAPGNEPTEAVLDSFQEARLLAGIPPVPEPSPLDGELILTRYPEISSAGSLLISPGSSYGLIVPQASIGSSNAVIVSPSGAGGGSGGVGSVSGGGGVSSPSYPSSGGNPPLPPDGPWAPGSTPPALIAYVPPALIPLLPPTGPYGPPQPYVPNTSYVAAPPTPVVPPGVQPPTATPPIFVPPTAFPPNSPPLTPPDQPPGTPPTFPPGSGTPPLSSPPPVLDPPPPQDTSVPEPRTFFLVAGALAAYGASRYLAKR